jgi:TolB protein
MPMDKKAFLDDDGPFLSSDNINFKNWSVVGAELLLKGGYTCIGRSVEVEVRLYDIFWGRQILGKKFLGKIGDHRRLMHRIGNEIVRTLTGINGVFLTRLAFVSTNGKHKEIYISDFDGRNIRRVTSDKSIAMLPNWSPQGGSIIYSSYKDGWAMLYTKGLSSGKVRKISGKKGLNIGACYVPGSKNLALTLSYEGNPDIYMIDQRGKIIKRLTSHWGADISPSFSPDGKIMAFVSDRSGSPQIYVKDLAKGREERLTFEGKYNTSPAWSSMNRLAFSQMQDAVVDIFTMNPDGTNIVRLTENQGNNEDPCWSPDGRYIIFSSNRTGEYHLYIMNANGQNQSRITYLEGAQTAPSWSPF